MQIPLLKGIYASDLDFRTVYPRNLVPVPKTTGLSSGYIKPAEGIVQLGSGTPGLDRGGINWDGICYRVLGNRLVSVAEDGTITTIGSVGNDGKPVSLDYSFDRLAIASNENLYYYDGATLTHVTDVDLGVVVDMIWVDSYFMTTDGEYIVVTELTDPTSVQTTKYGSAEADPDPVLGLIKIGNEPHAVNRYTIEVFDNIGGSGFPFQRIEGAKISKGAVGTHAFCGLVDGVAFVGSGRAGKHRSESIAVWYGYGGAATKLSSDEIDMVLDQYTEDELSEVELESRVLKGHEFLYVHLPCGTYVYDHTATVAVEEVVWHKLNSAILEDDSVYRARHHVYCYNQWMVGDTNEAQIGFLSDDVGTHWGETIGWEFRTDLIYNNGNSGIIHDLELFGLPGQMAYGDEPTIWTAYSTDGETFSSEKPLKIGKQGETQKRLVWFGQGLLNKWRIQKFRGLSDARLTIARIEATVEALNF